MYDTPRRNRLSPPLMFAFRSAFAARDSKKPSAPSEEAGQRVALGRRSASRSPITEPQLRREVARDLESLLNTVAMESAEDIEAFPAVRNSILNFGLPDIAHRTIDEGGVGDVRDEIRTALMNYEPRLAPESIQAKRDETVDSVELKVRFVVRAELRCEPVNVPVEFVADVELESGSIQVNRL
jgi:type VI secretion system protein ImpF